MNGSDPMPDPRLRPKTAEERAEAQQWASKVQDLEGTVFRLQDELEVANKQIHKLRIELSAAYGLLDSYQGENERIRRTFKATIDEAIEACDALLKKS